MRHKLVAGLLSACMGAVILTGCAPRVGLLYAFDLRTPEGYLPHPNMGFRSGDRFRMRIVPDQHCFIYVLHEGTDGTYSMLFPLGIVEGGKNHVLAGQTIQIPPTGNLAIDEKAGIETLYVMASLAPIPELERLRGRETPVAPDEFKLALKNIDIAYKISGASKSTRMDQFTHEVVKGSTILKVDLKITHI